MCQSCLYKGRKKHESHEYICAKCNNHNDYAITLIEREKKSAALYLNKHHPMMLCAKIEIVWNWPIGSGKEGF